MKKAIFLRILAVLVLLGGIFYIIYSDYKQMKLSLGDSPVDLATSTPLVNLPTATINSVDAEKDSLAIPPPSLDRPYKLPASVDKILGARVMKDIESSIISLRSDPDQFGKWLDLALLRKFIEDYDGAEEIWVFMSKEWADNPIAFGNLGDLYTFYLKNYPKAEANLKMVIDIDPSDVSAYRNLYMLYTNQYTEKKSEALPTLLVGIKANQKVTDLMVLAAGYYKDAGDGAKAKEYYNMALPLAEAQKNDFLIDFLNKELKNL